MVRRINDSQNASCNEGKSEKGSRNSDKNFGGHSVAAARDRPWSPPPPPTSFIFVHLPQFVVIVQICTLHRLSTDNFWQLT